MSSTEYIEINAEKRFGKPIVIGTRISVYDILNWLDEGMTIKEIIIDYPELNEEQIQACIVYLTDKEHNNS